MNIIKRDGSQAVFDAAKVAAAIRKANATVDDADKLTDARIDRIASQIEQFASAHKRALDVEEIQDVVETKIMEAGGSAVAKKYIKYRFIQELKRQNNTTDGEILSLINCTNEEAKQENANKNPVVNSTQRDYMAGAVSKDVTKRLLLPEDIVKAHEDGLLHFHDMDYYAQRMHNCDLVNLEDMLQNGTVISGTQIERPHSFSTACNIATQIIAQVASNQYGGQSISLTHLAPFVQVSREKITREVKEELALVGVAPTPDKVSSIVERRVRDEIVRGVQTIQYQVVTLMTTNGQAPFITVFMYLNEARSEQEKKDLAVIIEEVLKQRIKGVTAGSEIPVYRMYVGTGANQTRLKDVRKTLLKFKSYQPTHHKNKLMAAIHPRTRFVLTKTELTVLNERLRTLQLKNGMSVPKGVDPMHPQRVSRRAMRGR